MQDHANKKAEEARLKGVHDTKKSEQERPTPPGKQRKRQYKVKKRPMITRLGPCLGSYQPCGAESAMDTEEGEKNQAKG